MTEEQARGKVIWVKKMSETHEYLKQNNYTWLDLSELCDMVFPGILLAHFYRKVIRVLERAGHVIVREKQDQYSLDIKKKYGITLYECRLKH